jgi:hypothetical protein
MRSTLLLAIVLFATASRPSQAQDVTFDRVALLRDTVVSGVPCAATGRLRAEFFPDGRLHECPLARVFSTYGHQFTPGTWLIFEGDGRLHGAWLATDTPLSGHQCRGTGFQGWSVRFHANGALASCYLAAEAVIEGVPCQRGTFWNEIRGGTRTAVHFRDDGRLRQCQAARRVEIGGQRYDKWDVVVLPPPR